MHEQGDTSSASSTSAHDTGGGDEPTPIERYGRLHVEGVQLVDACDRPVQLRGVSDQGIQWFPWGTCFTDESLGYLRDALAIDVVRVPVYVEEGGWLDDSEQMRQRTHAIADAAIARGLYVVIDWHVTSCDPRDRMVEATAFWTEIATAYAGVPNVIYEIANEPAEVEWSGIAEYAEEIIDTIRAIDPEVVIIVGTPDDSGELSDAADAPLAASDVLYTFHYYAASMDLDQIEPYLERMPLFVTEWSAASYSGNSPDDYDDAAALRTALEGPAQQVSWIAWSFTDDSESSAMLISGTCAEQPGAPAGPWNDAMLSTSGEFMRDGLLAPEKPAACVDRM